jgi:copper chaperone CopZ
MRIEVLYFDGCPNHKPVVERVQELLRDEAISAEVVEVNVSDASTAQELDFLGSPSVRVDGLDVEPEARSARDYGMMCRTYAVDGRREGLPSREMLRHAIREARSGIGNSGSGPVPPKESKRASLFAAGSVFAAIIASFCCILPIVFAVTGFSILGASALFDAWRPYLLGLTFGLLVLGFYFGYRPGKEQCVPGSVCALPATKRSGRGLLWLATVGVVVFAAFPYYSASVAELALSGTSPATASESPRLQHVSFVVQDMDCADCANAVENKLKALNGVRKLAVSVESRTAEIDYDPHSTTVSELESAIKDAGYDARKI